MLRAVPPPVPRPRRAVSQLGPATDATAQGARPAVRTRVRPIAALGCALLLSPSWAQSARADVIRDGTIGSAGPGQVMTDVGPGGGVDYLIRESDGERAGANLFHSFERFDLTASERAIYQGDASIQNLFTRVTGGASMIDGVLASEIPGANLFFVNPAGVVFGENASVDLTGSFYVSTADRMLFDNGDVFETRLGTPTTVSVANLAGFGFLEAPAPISIRGSQIELALDQNFGLVGGDLEIRGDRSDGETGLVSARSGRIDLASLRSSGEVYIDADVTGDGLGDGVLRIENVTERGDITIAGNTSVRTSGIALDPYDGRNNQPGEGSGPVNLTAHDLTIEDADIFTLTVTDEDAGDVTIDLTGDFVARSVPGGRASGIVAGTGLKIAAAPGEIATGLVDVGTWSTSRVVVILCQSGPCAVSYTANGDAGDVLIRAANLRLEDGGRITTRSDTRGDAGTIRLEISDSIVFSGIEENGERSGLSSTADDTGNPGTIEILSPTATLVMQDSAAIVIQNSDRSLATGSPGRIEIDVASLDMSGDARIDSSTRGAGPGGDLDIRTAEFVRLAGRTDANEFTGITTLSQPGSTGRAGNVRIETAVLSLEDGAEISARPVGSGALGDAGSLEFEVSDRISLRDSTISTESENAAGGNLIARFGRRLDATNSSITSSVTAGEASGGNVTLLSDPGSIVLLDNSRIVAQADEGSGGNILIEASLLLADGSSLISASSNIEGLDGSVVTRAPDGDSLDLIQNLSPPTLDASALLNEPCSARRPAGANSLVVAQPEGAPAGVDAFLSAPLPRSLYARLDAPDADLETGAETGIDASASPLAERDATLLAQASSALPGLRGRSVRCAR